MELGLCQFFCWIRFFNVFVLDVVLNDITGLSGMAIIQAILSGARDPEYLASLVSTRVKRLRHEIAAALHGWWREELLFELEACLDLYRLYEGKLNECVQVIGQFLVKHAPKTAVSVQEEKQLKANRKKRGKHAPGFDLPHPAFRYFQTDLFAVSGISFNFNTVLCLRTNMGRDLHRFPTAKSFACWLGLVPTTR